MARVQGHTYYIPGCIRLRSVGEAERAGGAGYVKVTGHVAPRQTRPAPRSPAVLPSTEQSLCQCGRPKAALGSDTPRPALPRAEAIKGLASVAGARTRPGDGLTQQRSTVR